MTRRIGLLASTLATCGLALAVALPAAATDTPPVSGDPRATAHAGNAVDCEDADLAGEIVEGLTFVIDESGRYLTITSVPDGIELTGVVVKGSNAYNVYPPDDLVGLHAPLNPGGVAQISHWYACGVEEGSTTTSSSDSSPTSSDVADTDVPSDTEGGTSPEVSNAGLANTGVSARGLLVAGGGLLLVGIALMLGVRAARRRTQN